MSKRQRSDSAVEEAAISDYIDACVDFKSNVTIVDSTTMASHAFAENILIVGTKDDYTSGETIKSIPPYTASAEVREAAARMTEDGKTLSVFAKVGDAYRKVTLYSAPTKASRTNCPYRPDAICEAVSAACGAIETQAGSAAAAAKKPKTEEPAVEKVLDIIALTPEGSEAAVCKAVASGSPHSFTCKSGAGAAACKNKDEVKIHLMFPAANAAIYGQSGTNSPADLESLMTYIQLCQRLIDTPTNYLDTIVFAEIASKYAQKYGCDVKIIKDKELQDQGYGGIYGVGKGAQYPPHLVTLHYENKNTSGNGPEKNIALVGKGLVYDCGGLALKPAVHMCNMKTDMGGAAATFCGFLTLVACLQNGQNAARTYNDKGIKHLSVTLCLAENAIGPLAFRNDDILIMKSGKSIEVKNTDAEGRLCLGDGVHFATDPSANFFTPDILIDMATLTGAQGIATGTKHAAIYANDEEAEKTILASGKKSGDTCFPVLYCPEYHQPQYRSPCADLRNVMLSGTDGGVSCAGYFVEANVNKDYQGKHIHVDLAFPTFNDRGATGYGVALLAEFCREL